MQSISMSLVKHEKNFKRIFLCPKKLQGNFLWFSLRSNFINNKKGINNMDKRLKMLHTEADVKAFLEVLGVYAVLALVLIGAYYLGPAITGFATVTKQFNYSDEVSLEFGESSEYVWNLANPGSLKSIRITGSKTGQGEAKVYIEDDGARYLVFDSSKLAGKPSSAFGITGFAVLEDKDLKDKEGAEIKTEVDGVLGNEQQAIFDLLVRNINETMNNIEIELEADDGRVSKEIKGTATELQNELINNLSLSLENSTEKIKIMIEAEFEGLERETEIPVNGTAIINETTTNETANEALENETIINNTAKKTINIGLDYGSNEIYDADNDGIESLSGVIDFSVDGSEFSWNADQGKLCTRFEIFSVESQESNLVCFGNSECCALVELQSSRGSWNDGMFLSYGDYGSTANNIIFAQVLYANYSLDIDEPYSEIVYSPWGNKTANFEEGLIQFDSACADTCTFSGNKSSYKLVVEIENTTLRISNIEYLVEESAANAYPVLLKEIENISILRNVEYAMDLRNYFFDEDGDYMAYGYYKMDDAAIRFDGSLAYIRLDDNFSGSRLTFITANDSYGTAVSNVFKIGAKSGELGIELESSAINENNWTVGFRTTGTGDLKISAANETTYAELYNDNASTANNLDILELECGDFEIFDKNELIESGGVWFILVNGSKAKLIDLVGESLPIRSLLIEGYNCDNKIGRYTARVLTKGESIQELKFGNETKIAGIDYAEGVLKEAFEVRDKEGNKLMVLDSYGNINLKGNLTQGIFMEADENDFVIEDAEGLLNLVVKSPEGNVMLKGSLNENQSELLPAPNSFIIQNRNGEIVAYINSSGSLFLKGALSENILLE